MIDDLLKRVEKIIPKQLLFKGIEKTFIKI